MGDLISFRGRGFPAEPIRMMIWIGLLTGLLIYHAIRLWTAPYPDTKPPGLDAPAVEAVDRYAGPVRVIDGDTFHYAGMRIRIADIDTPEVNGRCAYETELAARATRRMRSLLADGPFELHPLPDGRDVDRFGRALRIVTRNGRSLGDQLVAEGLARTWTGRREPWCA